MTVKNQSGKRESWQVIRRFDGARDPEELLRALIQAHRR